MPIIVKDFVWNQTENTVTIKVPLRGVHPSKCDILYTKHYIKASFEKYFFEVLLSHEIDSKKSVCIVSPNDIVFELIKCENQQWEQLEANISKAEKQALKLQYLEEEYQRIQEQSEAEKNVRHKLKKVAVSEQINIDQEQRNKINNIKEIEKVNALKNLKVWKKQSKNIEKKPEVSVPPPRTSATLSVDFTPREFPTPSRESKLSEEEEWLRKQAEARRSVGFISEDLRPEEHNPQFLKEKGDEFFRSKNFLAAISAYSFGITLNNKFADLYVGRAQAHLALGNYNKVTNDCSTALDLMKPAVSQNLRERALCIGWRGIALAQLGLPQEGIEELKASLCLRPNEGLQEKLQEILDAQEMEL